MPSIDRRHLLGTAAASLVGSVAVRRAADGSDLEPAAETGAWHQPRRDASNAAATTDPGPATDGSIGWTRTVQSGNGSGGFAGVALQGETLLVPGNRRLVALDATTGDREWTFRPAERRWSLGSSPRVRESTALLAFGSVYVYAISLESRRPRWRYRTNGTISTMALAGNTLCFDSFVDGEDLIVALDAETGRERWRLPGRLDDAGASGDLLVAVRRRDRAADRELAGIDLESGTVIWSESIEGLSLGSAVVALEERVVVTGREGTTVLESATGKVQTSVEGVTSAGGVAVDPGRERLYGADPQNGVVRCAGLDGDRWWTVDTDVESAISVGDETVYVATPDGLLALDAADGDRRFAVAPEGVNRASRPNRIESTPLVAGETVYHRVGDVVYEVRAE